MPSDENVIALWGPSGSGKTWLVRSLRQSLGLFNNDEDLDWEFTVQDVDTGDEILLSTEAPPLEATLGPDPRQYLVTRRPKPPASRRPRTIVNTHTHHLQVRDIQGDWTWNRDSQDGITRDTTRVNFENATAIIIALDHTLLNKSTARNIPTTELSSTQDDIDYTSEENYNGGASREDWVDRVRSLATELRKTKKEFRIAICVTKIDQCNVRQWDASQVIESLYGPRMKELITDLGKYFSVKEFCVSSAGFLADNMETPNFDQATAEIRDKDNWRPYKVHAPFFWLFEEQERERLAGQGNSLAKLLFSEHRLRMHAPYPGTDV